MQARSRYLHYLLNIRLDDASCETTIVVLEEDSPPVIRMMVFSAAIVPYTTVNRRGLRSQPDERCAVRPWFTSYTLRSCTSTSLSGMDQQSAVFIVHYSRLLAYIKRPANHCPTVGFFSGSIPKLNICVQPAQHPTSRSQS